MIFLNAYLKTLIYFCSFFNGIYTIILYHTMMIVDIINMNMNLMINHCVGMQNHSKLTSLTSTSIDIFFNNLFIFIFLR